MQHCPEQSIMYSQRMGIISAKSKYLTSKLGDLNGLLSIILQGTSELLP